MRNRLLGLAATALLSFASPVWAQVGVTYSDLSSALTTAPSNCAPPDGSRKILILQNLSGGNIGFCYRTAAAPATACVPVIGNTGTFTVAAGATYTWPMNGAPTNGLDCVGVGAANISVTSGK